MFGKKKKYDFNTYITVVSSLAEHAYKSSERDVAKLELKDKKTLLTGLDFARLYLITDLAAAWLNFDVATKNEFEKRLFGGFYSAFPDDFLTDLRSAIKSDDTRLGDVCDFIATNFSNDAFEELSILSYVTADLAASLQMFAALFRATEIKNGQYIVDYRKLRTK